MNELVTSGAPVPANEAQRLAALRSYDLLGGSNDETLDAICRVVAAIFAVPIALVSLSDTSRQVFKGRVGLDASDLARELAPCAHAILGDEPLIIENALADARFCTSPIVLGPPHLRFYIGMPLLTPDGFALGTLCAIDSRARRPSRSAVDTLVDLSHVVMEMFNMRLAMTRTRDLALTDALTGLVNRAGLMLEVERLIDDAIGRPGPFALLYIDVDNFKFINDTRGHATGDAVLQLIGTTLEHSVRHEDLAGRLGGDEFAVVIRQSDAREAAQLADRVMRKLSAAMREACYPIGFSIGLAVFSTPPGSVVEALSVADRLMYAAKSSGKNRIVMSSTTACADRPTATSR